MLIQVMLLAASLSLDGLGIGFSYGLRAIKIPILANCIIFFIALFVSIISVIIGVQLSNVLSQDMLTFIGVAILFMLGMYIIFQNTTGGEKYDLNCSKVIEPREAIYLGLSLSLDSIGAGIAAVALGFNAFATPIIISTFLILFMNIGIFVGSKFSHISSKRQSLSIFSGVIIILVAVSRLL